MIKRILLIGLTVITMFTHVATDISFAESPKAVERADTLEEKCGLHPLVQMEVPEDKGISEGADQFRFLGKMGRETDTETTEWEKCGSKFLYNQLTATERTFWDNLDDLALYYLTGKANANAYDSWYGTDWLTYENLSEDRIRDITYFFMFSNPQYYFLLPGYSLDSHSKTSGRISLIFDERVSNGNKRAAKTRELKNIIDDSVAQMNRKESDLEREKVAHDLICERVVYDHNLEDDNVFHNQTVYSVFFTDRTVCAGYSQAMELLCNAAGIDCMAVTSETHEWNLIRINDTWYYTDLTWNDGDFDEIYYQYFNRSMEMLLTLEDENSGNQGENHIPEDFWKDYLPECTRDSGAGKNDIGTVFVPEEQALPPIISVDDYGTVSISHESDAELYYTTDGRIPSVAKDKSYKYKTIFSAYPGASVKAMAAQDGYWDSETAVFECPTETIQAYAGQPFIYYVRTEHTGQFNVEGLEALTAGGASASFDKAAGRILWTPIEAQVGECYRLVFSVDNGGQTMMKAVNIQVLDASKENVAIVGMEKLEVAEGYAATVTDSYAITGTEKISSVILSGNTGTGKIKWNDTNCQIEIGEGLTKGLYKVRIHANAGENEICTLDFNLNVTDGGKSNHLPVFENPNETIDAYTGQPLVFYVKASDADLGDKVRFGNPDLSGLGKTGKAAFDLDTGRFCWTPDQSMKGKSFHAVFTAYDNARKPVRHTVTIRVKSISDELSSSPAINGPDKMTLSEGYEETLETDSFNITSAGSSASVALSLSDSDELYGGYFAWKEQTRQLEIKPGLPAGTYEVKLTATLQLRQVDCKFTLYVEEVGKEQLLTAYQEAVERQQGNYTSGSWAKFQGCLAVVKRVLDDRTATASDVAVAVKMLEDANSIPETLEEMWNRLLTAYTKDDGAKNNYTPKSWKEYQEVLAKMGKMPDPLTEESINENIQELMQAYENLRLVADKSGLKSMMDAVDALVESDYTADSYARLRKARNEVQLIYADVDATQSHVDAAYYYLLQAKDALVKSKAKQDNPGKIENNKKYTDIKSKIQYKVLNASQRTVAVVTYTNKNISNLTIPGSVTINGVKCRVTEINNKAFKNFENLKKVTIGQNVTKIGKQSFYGCGKLTTVIIGANVKTIEKQSFQNCDKLKRLTLKGNKITSIKSCAFKNTYAKIRVKLTEKMSRQKKDALKKKLKKAGISKKAVFK